MLLGTGLALFAEETVRRTVRTLTRPPRRTYSWALARARPGDPGELPNPKPYESWTFRSRGDDLPVWDIAGDRPEGPVVVLTHGWGDSRVTMMPRIEALAKSASRVIAWDLPGHGEAPGRCTLGVHEVSDLAALLAKLAADGVRPPVVYGFSLGAAVSLAAIVGAGAPPVRAVILEAPYRFPVTPAANVLASMGLPYRWNLPLALWWIGLCLGGKLRAAAFDRTRFAAEVRVPLLVVHGDADETCPLADAERIAEVGHGHLAAIPGGMHLTLWTDGRTRGAVSAAVGEFLGTLGPQT